MTEIPTGEALENLDGLEGLNTDLDTPIVPAVGGASTRATGTYPPTPTGERTSTESKSEFLERTLGAYATSWNSYIQSQVLGDGSEGLPSIVMTAEKVREIKQQYERAGGTGKPWDEVYRTQVAFFEKKNYKNVIAQLKDLTKNVVPKHPDGEQPHERERSGNMITAANANAKQIVADLLAAVTVGGTANIMLADGEIHKARLSIKTDDITAKEVTPFNDLTGERAHDKTMSSQINRDGSTFYNLTDVTDYIRYGSAIAAGGEPHVDKMREALGLHSDDPDKDRFSSGYVKNYLGKRGVDDQDQGQSFFATGSLTRPTGAEEGYGVNAWGGEPGGAWISTGELFSAVLTANGVEREEPAESATVADSDDVFGEMPGSEEGLPSSDTITRLMEDLRSGAKLSEEDKLTLCEPFAYTMEFKIYEATDNYDSYNKIDRILELIDTRLSAAGVINSSIVSDNCINVSFAKTSVDSILDYLKTASFPINEQDILDLFSLSDIIADAIASVAAEEPVAAETAPSGEATFVVEFVGDDESDEEYTVFSPSIPAGTSDTESPIELELVGPEDDSSPLDGEPEVLEGSSTTESEEAERRAMKEKKEQLNKLAKAFQTAFASEGYSSFSVIGKKHKFIKDAGAKLLERGLITNSDYLTGNPVSYHARLNLSDTAKDRLLEYRDSGGELSTVGIVNYLLSSSSTDEAPAEQPAEIAAAEPASESTPEPVAESEPTAADDLLAGADNTLNNYDWLQ